MAKKKTSKKTEAVSNPLKCNKKGCGFIAKSKGGLTTHSKKHKAGRPKGSKMDDPTVQADLMAAAALGANNEACCAYAKVSTSIFYAYITDHPDFSERLEQKRNDPYLTAIQTVVRAIKDDPKLALKYLERKHKDEYSLRREMTGADGAKLFEGMSDEEIRRFITSGND